MIFVSDASGRPATGTSIPAALLGALLLLAGCGGEAQQAATLDPAVAPAMVQGDPLGRFVASAAPGQSGAVVLADGRTAQVQVLRAYAAASGRECREVLVGGTAGRASLLCQADGQWVAARPLLLGSGSARP
jgi:hypothetical protein